MHRHKNDVVVKQEKAAAPRPNARAAMLTSGALMLIVLAHAFLGSFSRYMADDYWLAERARLGPAAVLWWYVHWTGRYSFIGASTLLYRLPPAMTGALPATLLLVWCVGLCLFLRRATPNATALAVLIVAAVLTMTPNVRQSVYWQACSLVVLAPLVITPWLALCIVARPHPALVFLLALLLGGFCETFTLLQIVALGWLAAAFPMRRKPLLVALAGSITALAMSFMAPGNAVRVSVNPHPRGLNLIGETLAHTTGLLASLPWLGLLAIGLLAACLDLKVPRPKSPLLTFALIPALWLVAALSEFTTTYGLGEPLPPRTVIIPLFFFVIAAVWIGGMFRVAAWVGTGMALWWWTNTLFYTLDTTPQMAAFARQWTQQARVLQRGQTRVPLVYNSYNLDAINPNREFWVNIRVAEYYKLPFVEGH